MANKLMVDTQTTSYPIYIKHGLLREIGSYIQQISDMDNYDDVLLVSNETVNPLYGQTVVEQFEGIGKQVYTYILPDGEFYKTWDMAEKVIAFALSKQLPRRTILVALGGGVVGDLAGFVAAIYLRGIPFIQIPTTLLAQVDSSVGGKVAVNHALGKNMIGSFYQPKIVLADINTLNTLPEREWLAGLAEGIKYGIIWDYRFYQFLQANRQSILARDQACVARVIARCCEIKAAIVNIDEKEQGLRAILNFGHTIGHALERATEYKVYRHGEAVAVGMVAAAKLGMLLGVCSDYEVNELINTLQNFGLPTKLPAIPLQQIFDGIRYDKKTIGNNITFILPKKIGEVAIVNVVDKAEQGKILEALSLMERE